MLVYRSDSGEMPLLYRCCAAWVPGGAVGERLISYFSCEDNLILGEGNFQKNIDS